MKLQEERVKRLTKRDELSLRVVLALPKATNRECYDQKKKKKKTLLTFKHRVRVEKLILDVINLLAATRDSCDVLHDDLGSLGLAGTRLALGSSVLDIKK